MRHGSLWDGFLSGTAAFLAMALIGLAASPSASADINAIEWQTPAPQVAAAALEPSAVLGAGTARHVVVQFAKPVDDDAKARMEASGVQLVQYLGSNSFFASVAAGPAAAEAARGAGIAEASEIALNWKLHPAIARDEYPEYARFASAGAAGRIEASGGDQVDTVALYVVFHGDIDLNSTGMDLLKAHGGLVRDFMYSINAVVAWLPVAEVKALAAEDAVQWIEPPLPPITTVNDSNRTNTGVNILQAAPYNLSGAGVNVLVYDGGTARATHQDFGGRLTVRDASGMGDHPTHVSATVGGSGAASGGTYRGMAPGVVIQSYGFQWDGTGHWLYTNPGDLENDYNAAINTYGAELANNSIGSNLAPYGYPCAWEGDYGATSMLIDAIVRGSLGAPMRIVWANGNERSYSCGSGYHLTAPPACAKNHITVGALNSNNDTMTSFSSWGPSDDGRIKPDITGPGCQSGGDGGVTSCGSSSDTAYTTMCGTSMACPTVTGICALILQDWKALFPADPLPRNSTMKVLLAHNALDLGNTGPDYQFGFGRVRAQNSIDFMRSGTFIEESISQGGQVEYFVSVPGGASQLMATIAWDDPPGAANTIPELVNDIDIIAIEPGTGTIHYPWTLNPASGSEGNPAVRTTADHRNNIEQVVVDTPASGTWTIRVSGFAIPTGPQVFSLATTPNFSTASARGTISLNSAMYACSDTATITVTDIDLNTNPGTAQTVNVNIESTSEPAPGETVVLTETGPDTSIFTSSIALSESNAAGVLLVAHGDTITATYIDANDGSGGINVTVTDTATVDCDGPIISNVAITGIQAHQATVTFTTSEPALGQVHYGLACGSLVLTASGVGLQTNHSITLAGLTQDTPYFLSVEAADEAGNTATDDNGGACYTFTTLSQPDYFTELFDASDNDTDNQTLFFTPDGSADFYNACRETAASFLSDPTGGSFYTLSDDSYATVTLTGGRHVSLYGVSYTTFYVGSNGYVTFGSGDGNWGESLAGHFNRPRISGLFDDLNPQGGGTISSKEFADHVAITYQNVPQLGTTDSNSFQIEIYYDGTPNAGLITLTHLSIAALDGLAGLSRGTGQPADFVESNLNGYPACSALQVTPTSGLDASGMEGGPFAPSQATYTLTNTDMANPVAWTATKTQAWVDLSSAGGSIPAGSFITVDVSINANANALAPGLYTDIVTFTDTGSSETFLRGVNLEVIAIPGEIDVTDSIPPQDDLTMPFGNVVVGMSRAEQITISNLDADHALDIIDIHILGSGYQEDFDDGLAQGWEEIGDADWEIIAGEYRSQSGVAGWKQSTYTGETWADCDVEMEFRRTGGTGNPGVLLARATENFNRPAATGDAYAVGVAGNSQYWVAKYIGGVLTFLQSWASSPFLNPDTASNVVKMTVQGTSISVYFNGNLAWSGSDASIPGPGRIGLMSYVASANDPVYYFDNVRVGAPGALTALNNEVHPEQAWYNAHSLVEGDDATAPDPNLTIREPYQGEQWVPAANNNGVLASVPAFTLANLPALPVSVPAGDSLTFDVIFEPETVEPHTATVSIESNDTDEPVVEVALDGAGTLDDLAAAPPESLDAAGPQGGPFAPDSKVYTLTNAGLAPLDWSATVSDSWVDVTPSSGTLTPASPNVDVTVSLNALADALPAGNHTLAVTFNNLTSGASSVARDVNLEARPVDTFIWDPVSSPQGLDIGFPVTVTAVDAMGATVRGFEDVVDLSAYTGSGTSASIVISEIETNTPDAVEFTNVSGQPVDISNWTLYLYDNVSWPNPLLALPVAPGTVIPTDGVFWIEEMGTPPGTYPTFYLGSNIDWTSGSPAVGVLGVDNLGNITDFATCGDSTQITNPMTIPAAEWSGAGITLAGSSNSYQRIGTSDNNTAADWINAVKNMGSLNPGFTIPWASFTPVPITPIVSTNFVDGVWNGAVTVQAEASQVRLRAEDGGSLGDSNPFDVVAIPHVVNVTSPVADGAYGDATLIPIEVEFSQEVVVSFPGFPMLDLNTTAGGVGICTEGSGTDTLIFTYVVNPGQNSPDLDYEHSGSLSLNGTTIRDLATGTIDADLFLPLTGTPGSLGFNKDIVIDTLAPTVDIVDVAPDPRNTPVAAVNIEFSEAVVSFTIDDLDLTRDGGSDLLTGAEALTTADNESWTLDVSALTTLDGSYLLTVYAEGITDAAGNAVSAAATDDWVTDATPPTAVISHSAACPTGANAITFTVTFSEDVSLTFTPDKVSAAPGALPILSPVAIVPSGSDYAVTATFANPNANGIAGIAIAGGTVTDAAGNPYAGALSPTCDICNWSGFLEEPVAPALYEGDSHVFEVVPSCTGATVSYMWWWDDGSKAEIHVGDDSPSYSIPNVTGQAGQYWCEVTYDGITYPTTPVMLQVQPHLWVVEPPEDGEAHAGQSFTFGIEVDGGYEPYVYVWSKDGDEVSYDPECVLTDLADEDAGTYEVTVTDEYGDSVSAEGQLDVLVGVPVAGAMALAALVSGLALAGAAATRRRRNLK